MLRRRVDTGRRRLRVLQDRRDGVGVLKHRAGADEHEAPPAPSPGGVEQIGRRADIGLHRGQGLRPRKGLVRDRCEVDAGIDGMLGGELVDFSRIRQIALRPCDVAARRSGVLGLISAAIGRDHATTLGGGATRHPLADMTRRAGYKQRQGAIPHR
jgi:hypothetical protein